MQNKRYKKMFYFKAPHPKCLTATHHPRCDPEIGLSYNYGFTSIPETLGGDAGGNADGGGAAWSPAEVHP